MEGQTELVQLGEAFLAEGACRTMAEGDGSPPMDDDVPLLSERGDVHIGDHAPPCTSTCLSDAGRMKIRGLFALSCGLALVGVASSLLLRDYGPARPATGENRSLEQSSPRWGWVPATGDKRVHVAVKSPAVFHKIGSGSSPTSTSTTSTTMTITSTTTTTTTTGPPERVFYVYRAQSDDTYVEENVNVANLPGVLYYLHAWVLPKQRCGYLYNISRIMRFIVTMRATQQVYYPNLVEFLPWVPCDSGRCAGTYNWQTGWNPGCQIMVGPDNADFAYPVGVWYSFPGSCPSMKVGDKTPQCRAQEPGGHCEHPNGNVDCTWRLHFAGEVRLDDLCPGALNTPAWCQDGSTVYNIQEDRGYGCSFWDDRGNINLGQDRVQFVKELFEKKYPYSPKYDEPECPFTGHL